MDHTAIRRDQPELRNQLLRQRRDVGRGVIAEVHETNEGRPSRWVMAVSLVPTERARRNSCEMSRYATFLNTSAEFFDPNAMQLHTACSIACFRPALGT
jgi:hypothetical protein